VKLTDIMNKILGIEVGLDSKFNELPFSSFTKMLLLTAINRYFRVNLSYFELIECNTINDINTLISEQIPHISTYKNPTSIEIMKIKPSSFQETIFFIPSLSGLSISYLSFSNTKLACNLLALNNYAMSEKSYDAFHEVIEEYAEAIANQHSEGNLNICGYSLCGVIALEVARYLVEKLNRKINYLILIDTPLISEDSKNIEIDKYCKTNTIYTNGPLQIDNQEIIESQFQLIKDYSVKPYSHSKILFLADNSNQSLPTWTDIIQSEIISYRIPVNHYHMLDQENIKYIIQAIQTSLLEPIPEISTFSNKNQNLFNLLFNIKKLFPEKIALIDPDDSFLSYKELWSKLQRRANYLSALGVTQYSRVALYQSRSIHLVIDLLASWLCGAIVVPIDPAYGKEFTEHILTDIQPEFMITAEIPNNSLKYNKKMHIITHHELFNSENEECILNFICNNTDIALILYTSGTTGLPKGIQISHQAFIQRLDNLIKIYNIYADEIFLIRDLIGFDAFYEQLFCGLLSGATNVIYPALYHYDISHIPKFIESYHITCLNVMPPIMTALIEMPETDFYRMNSLKKIMIGGEVLHPIIANRFLNRFPVQLFYIYSPTENLMVSLYQKYTGENLASSLNFLLPIGNPLKSTAIFLLDNVGNEVNEGQIGEIYLADECLMKGYWQKFVLTATKIQWHFIAGKSQPFLLYQTRDLAYMNKCGEYCFVGRKEKEFSPYRSIALELIQTCLLSIPGNSITTQSVNRINGNPLTTIYLAYHGSVPKDFISTIVYILNQISKKKAHQYLPDKIIVLKTLPLTPQFKFDISAFYRLKEHQIIFNIDTWGLEKINAEISWKTQLADRIFSVDQTSLKKKYHASFFFKKQNNLIFSRQKNHKFKKLQKDSNLEDVSLESMLNGYSKIY
jgi:non-ribosomal peptide synthetase component F